VLRDAEDVDRTTSNNGLDRAHGTHVVSEPDAVDRASSAARLRLFGFGLFAAIYFLSFLQCVAVSVVADDLAMELGLDSVALGFMSSGFFIAYALVQPAMGLLCDKAGPERVGASALAIAAVGSFLFAGAQGFTSAFLGRILMGMGLAAGFIPGMKVIDAMFPPEAFSTYNGLFVAIGNAGTLMGAAPLAWPTVLAGWRLVFAGLAFAAVLLAVLCWVFATIRRTRAVPGWDPGDEPGSSRDVIRSRELWLLAFFLFTKYGSQVAFQGLWGVRYIANVYGVSPTTAAGAMTMMAARVRRGRSDDRQACRRHGGTGHEPHGCPAASAYCHYTAVCCNVGAAGLGPRAPAPECHVRSAVSHGSLRQFGQPGLWNSERLVPLECIRASHRPCKHHIHPGAELQCLLLWAGL